MKKNNTIVKEIVTIFGVNIINMIFGLITGFVLPKYLSVDTYASIKTFQLYLTVVGIFHLGYSDGVYLKYGGKSRSEIIGSDLVKVLSTMHGFQAIVCLIVLIVSICLKDPILILFSIDLFGYNIIDFYKRVYQAIGEFNKYAKTLNYVTLLNFAFNIILLFIIKSDHAYYYIMGYCFVDLIVLIYLEIITAKSIKPLKVTLRIDFMELRENIKCGILLLFGNFTSILITSMDRWFTKILLTVFDFAQYSFSVSVENLLNVAVTPVTITMYNYLCKESSGEKIKSLKQYMLIFAGILIGAFFPVKFIIEVYLDKYSEAIRVIALLFASQLCYIFIKSLYVNLYKARKQQKKYFFEVLIVIVIGFLFNALLFYIMRVKEAFAFGTLLSAIVWLLICNYDFHDIRMTAKEFAYILIVLFAFLGSALFLKSYLGIIIYYVSVVTLSIILMKKPFFELIKMGVETVSGFIKRKEW